MNNFERATIASAISMLLATAAGAQVHPEKPTWKYEKCYGVVKAGKNDCFTAKTACGGTVKRDRVGDAWIYIPAGTCEKIVGGSLKPIEG